MWHRSSSSEQETGLFLDRENDALWAIRVLTPEGVNSLKIEGHHAADEEWLRSRLAENGDFVEIYDFIKALKETGKVHLFGCKLAAETFNVSENNLLPETEKIVNPAWFLSEKAVKAEHCQYFWFLLLVRRAIEPAITFFLHLIHCFNS